MKIFSGIVTSTKMNKTIVVEVASKRIHPIYKKMMTSTKKYAVHDEKQVAKTGDKVSFTECRPLSKTVHCILKDIVKAAAISEAAPIIEEAKS